MAGETEIGDANFSGAVEHDVGGLEVAMNDAALVSGGEASANLARDFGGFVGREPADAADDGGEILAVDILHGEKRRAVGIADIEDAANVGMGNLASDANFGMKSRESGGVLREALGKKLDGDELGRASDLPRGRLRPCRHGLPWQRRDSARQSFVQE